MTYAQLKTDLIAFAGTDAEQQIPTAIRMAEAEMSRRVRCRQMAGRASMVINGAYLTLPGDFAGVRSLELSPGAPLEWVEPDRLSALAGLHPAPGAPVWYAVVGSEVRFVPAPSAPYAAGQLTYWKMVPALSDGAPVNWLLAAWPDAYLYGALKHLGSILADGRAGAWSTAFDAVLSQMATSLSLEEAGAG